MGQDDLGEDPRAAITQQAAPAPSPAGNQPDGRHLRAERSKEAVVAAILDLLREGNEQPSASQIAERSGVSVRSVFRHFDDLETLLATAVALQVERVLPLFELAPMKGPAGERVEAIIEQRSRLYEEIAPIRRAGERLRFTSEVIARHLEESQALLHGQVATLFAPELKPLAAKERTDLVDAIDLALGWHAWFHLRHEQGRTPAQACAVMALTVGALLHLPATCHPRAAGSDAKR